MRWRLPSELHDIVYKRATAARYASTLVRARFAPSPTGYLHLGGFRTALFNYLFVRKSKGQMILRIEDTDQARLVPGAQQALIEALEWAGIQFDEGPHLEGPFGPYIQSQRLNIYRQHISKLLDSEHAYPCFCSADRLNALRLQQKGRSALSVYDRHCLHTVKPAEARSRMASEPHVVRFKSDADGPPQAYQDLIYGPVSSPNAGQEDFVLLKTDGFPTYHLANVVDDHLMRISHVMRGEEWIPSTPKHLALYKAFGWDPPHFAHLPILVGAKGNKLSKRDGDVQVQQFKDQGWDPAALANFVALMSANWSKSSGTVDLKQEVMSMQDMIERFDWTSMNRHRSQADMGKLAFLNKEHLQRELALPNGPALLAGRLKPYLRELFGAREDTNDVAYIAKVIPILLERASNLQQMAELQDASIFFATPNWSSTAATRMLEKLAGDPETGPQEVLEVVRTASAAALDRICGDEVPDGFAHDLAATAPDLRLSTKQFMTALRYLLTAQPNGPGLQVIMSVLGKTRTLQRLKAYASMK